MAGSRCHGWCMSRGGVASSRSGCSSGADDLSAQALKNFITRGADSDGSPEQAGTCAIKRVDIDLAYKSSVTSGGTINNLSQICLALKVVDTDSW